MWGEAVQLYVSDKNGTAGRPVKELKGFAKVELQPGEIKTSAEFHLLQGIYLSTMKGLAIGMHLQELTRC